MNNVLFVKLVLGVFFMVYYFKESHQLKLLNDFILPVKDEKGMNKEWIAKFWSIDYFYVNEHGDLIYHHRHALYFRNKKAVIEKILKQRCFNLKPILTLHILDSYRYEWLEFYSLVELEDGSYKTKKLKQCHAHFKKDQSLVDSKGKTIPIDLKEYNSARTYREDKPVADNYGEIIRIKIIQKERLDIFNSDIQYFGVNSGIGKTLEQPYIANRYNKLLGELYEQIFLKGTDIFDETGGVIELYADNVNGFVYKYFKKEDFLLIKSILSKYITSEFIPVFLTDGVDAKKEEWWKPSTFVNN